MRRESEQSPAEFYDGLATDYHRLYPDWEAACQAQGEALADVLSRRVGPGPRHVLDAAVGIGTQLLGLARCGHRVTGTDLSRAAVRRARAECIARQVDAGLGVADMRALPFADHSFDAVVCADNAVAHLGSASGATRALRELARVTRPHGPVVVTVRDYEQARRDHPSGTLPQVWSSGDERTVTVQVWDWQPDGERYALQHFQLVGDGESWRVARRTATFWAVTRDELIDCAGRAGLEDVTWLVPAESGFFQPLLVARAPR